MSYWRNAGFSFVKYSNLCAAVTRNALKEPVRSQAKQRDAVSLVIMPWVNGKAPAPTTFISANRLTAYPASSLFSPDPNASSPFLSGRQDHCQHHT
jgi:F-type H+-transporting ATPase subunit epsilon